MPRPVVALLGLGLAAPALAVSAETPRAIVAALSGEAEIAPGVRLTDRYAAGNRAYVRQYLGDQLAALGLSPQRQAYRANGENVFATLPATAAAGDAVVIGAHFDSVRRSPGANDDASGVGLVAAVAEALAQATCRTRDLEIVFFDEEESGLVGSKAFADKLVRERQAIHSVHTVDQIGWDADGDRAIELEVPTQALRTLYAAVAADLSVPVYVTSTTSTDHQSFRSRGFAAIGITEEYVHGDTTPHYHRPTDTFDTVDFDYLASSAEVVAEAVRRLVTEGCP
jgi:Zn-dependent M28 family amino/carboxypeptidase